jgi:hypothetical protein
MQNLLRDGLQQLFMCEYYNKATCDSIHLDRLKRDVNIYLQQLSSQGYLPDNLDSVGVTDCGQGQITLDLLRAFKNCPKWQQEQICLQVLGLEPEDVAEFEYNTQGYISGIKLSQSIEQLEMTVEVNNDR